MIRSSTTDRVTTITLDRPEKLNAFAGSMREDLRAALADADARDDSGAIVITGAGRAFCAGGDVEVMRKLQSDRDSAAFRKLLDAGAAVILQIADMRKPVIAAINGIAAGAGCNLALACDYRIAAADAKLSESFVRIGLHPDWGGTWFLPRLAGPGRALELMMTGRTVDAAEALDIGMIDRVVAAEELLKASMSFARELADAPPIVAAGIKRAVRQAAGDDLRRQLELETEHQLRAFESSDAVEGLAALLEKRRPVFRGE